MPEKDADLERAAAAHDPSPPAPAGGVVEGGGFAGLLRPAPDGSLPGARADANGQRRLLLALQRSAGNAAVHRLLTDLAPPVPGAVARQPAAAAPAAKQAIIVADDGPAPGPGQMRRGEFLDMLKPAVVGTAEKTLASAAFTVASCPWIEHWIEHYRTRSPSDIESAIAQYAPAAASGGSAAHHVEAVCERVRAGIVAWETTGELPPAPAGGPPIGAGAAAPPVAFKLRDGAGPDQVAPEELQRRLGPGRPLEGAVGAQMGRALGADFSAVRVHDDPGAAGLTRSLGARAMAVGRHVAFAPYEYAPGTPIGDALIAHELAHVVQQGGVATVGRAAVRAPMTLEADADAAAIEAVLALHGGGGPARAAGPVMRSTLSLQRCGMPEADPRDPDPTATPGFDQPPLKATTLPTKPPAPAPPKLTLAEMQDRLNLTATVLGRMAGRYATDKPALAAIQKARAALAPVRAGLAPATAATAAGSIEVGAQIVDRSENVLLQLATTAKKLSAEPLEERRKNGYLLEIEKVRLAYLAAIGDVFAADQVDVFNAAEESAAKLPRKLTDVDLKVMERDGPPYDAAQQQDHVMWVVWTRAKLDELEADARVVAEARKQQAPNLADREKRFKAKAELVQLSLRGLNHYDRALQAGYEIQKGINVIPGVATSLWRLWNRCRAMHEAAVAGNIEDLKAKLQRHEADPAVEEFYKALPLFRFANDFAVKFGIVLAASIATAGVGGAVAGAIGETTTLSGTLLAGAGTAAVEALTFTVVSRGLTAALDQPVEGSFLSELAWNFGLFSILKGTAGLARRGAAAMGAPALAGPATMIAGFPLMHGYGLLRFRLSMDRWPSQEELDRMTAEGFITFLALMTSMRAVERYIPKGGGPSALRNFHRQYGWRFETLEAGRSKLMDDFTAVMREGKGTDAKAVNDLQTRAKVLEDTFKQIIDDVTKDPKIDLKAIRAELAKAGRMAPEGSSVLLAKELKLPETVGLRSAGGDRQFSYRWGGTTKLGDGLRAIGARVAVSPPDPVTGQKTMTVTMRDGDPEMTFQERVSSYPARVEVDIDPTAPEVAKLLSDLAVSDPGAAREVIRMLSTELARNPEHGLTGPIRLVRKAVEAAKKAKGVDAEAYLKERQTKGAATMAADPKLVTAAEGLIAEGTMRSRDWLELRDSGEYVGLIGERMATKQALGAAKPGQTVLKNVHLTGQLFDDAAMTKPHITGHGRAAIGVDVVPELDLLIGTLDKGTMRYSSVANVKAVQQKGSGEVAKQAQEQNTQALAALRAHEQGKPFQLPNGTWAKVEKITATDAATNARIDLTGKVQPAATVGERTIGPAAKGKAATPWTEQLPYTYQEIATIVEIMRERQAMSAPGY